MVFFCINLKMISRIKIESSSSTRTTNIIKYNSSYSKIICNFWVTRQKLSGWRPWKIGPLFSKIQLNWNIIFVDNLSWHENIHPDDRNVFNKYQEDMDIPQRRFKLITMWEENKSVEDRCDCGHWGVQTIKNMTRNIQKAYDEI